MSRTTSRKRTKGGGGEECVEGKIKKGGEEKKWRSLGETGGKKVSDNMKKLGREIQGEKGK